MKTKKAALLAIFTPLIVTPIVVRQAGLEHHDAGIGLSWEFIGGFVSGLAIVAVLAILFGQFRKKG